jgi:hypothetical protein
MTLPVDPVLGLGLVTAAISYPWPASSLIFVVFSLMIVAAAVSRFALP